MIARLLYALALLLAPPAFAQALLGGADMRPAQSLDGAWHWSVDPFRDGKAGFHGGPPNDSTRRWQDNIQADAAANNPRALYEFDMQRSPVVYLPGSWIGHAAEMRYYQGLVWYQRTFEAAKPAPGTRTFLRFGAADYTADVYLNGKSVGSHKGGFTPFAFDVTELLRDGNNQITVGVDSARTDDDVPPPVTDWETYGGITRSINLITVPETFVDDAWLRLGRDGRIHADVRMYGSAASNRDVAVRIPALGLTLSGKTGLDGQWTGNAPAPRALKRWSPETPVLYDVEIASGSDTLRDRVGFRTIETRGTQILLNGKPIFLRGISMHEEELGKDPVRAITPAAARALSPRSSRG